MFTSVALALLVNIDDACVLLQGNQYEAQYMDDLWCEVCCDIYIYVLWL